MNDQLSERYTPEVKAFIRAHLSANVQQLLLNPPKAHAEDIRWIADQLLARQKAKGKLDQWVENFDLIFPLPLSVEQASSEATARYKKSLVQGDHLVDLTGGMGIDCLSLCENFKQTTYVDANPQLCQTFRHNSGVLGKEMAVITDNAADFLQSFASKEHAREGNVLFVDPARRDDSKSRVFRLEHCTPDLTRLLPLMKEKATRHLIKLSPLLDIKALMNDITHIKEIHVVSVRNECKELLLLLDLSYTDEPFIRTVNIANEVEHFDFSFSEERAAKAPYGYPEMYLFEPNASILKAGAFNKVAVDLGLKKLHTHTHLYTFNKTRSGLPGRVFKVVEQKIDKKNILSFAPGGNINVITRNYPLTAPQLKKKYKLKDGGDLFLIGFRDLDEKPRLMVAEKVNDD